MELNGIFTMAVSLTALVLSILSFRFSKAKGKVEKAHEMAKAFEELLSDITLLTQLVYTLPNIDRLISKADKSRMRQFNRAEMNNIFNPGEQELLSRLFIKHDLLSPIIIEYFFSLYGRKIPLAPLPNTESTKNDIKIATSHAFNDLQASILNRLEWFSMAFSSNLADEETVYQSLHQAFLNTMKLLYFRIAYSNENSYDMYYLNAIELFRKWNERQAREQEEYQSNLLKDPRRRKKLR